MDRKVEVAVIDVNHRVFVRGDQKGLHSLLNAGGKIPLAFRRIVQIEAIGPGGCGTGITFRDIKHRQIAERDFFNNALRKRR